MKSNRPVKGKKLSPRRLEHQVLRVFQRKPKKRLNAKQLIKTLKITNSKTSVEEALNRLVANRQIARLRDNKYVYSSNGEGRSGRKVQDLPSYDGYVDRTRTGSAYIICEGLDRDIYVSAKRLGTALDGDKVRVQLLARGRHRLEGFVVEVLERATERFVGTFQELKNTGRVIPLGHHIPFEISIHPDVQSGAADGDIVLVTVEQWPDHQRRQPRGRIDRILDETDSHELKMESVLVNHGFSMDFSDEVQREAGLLSKQILQQDLARRRDFRQVPTCTIDPVTAKDFDDALSVQLLDNGHTQVGVHIADVTHYVRPNTALDREALHRSTSVYLVDRVAPMLPEELSNELCSLRPHEDSLTFSAVFEFNDRWALVDRWFGKTVIHSRHRYTYDEAQQSIDGQESVMQSELVKLNTIAMHLREQRFKDGSIGFESPEVQFELDENNHPIGIVTKERKEAHMLVEEFMLLANREVAAFIADKSPEVPLPYRVHDLPDEEKLADYAKLLAELGFRFDYQSPRQVRASFERLSAAAREDEALAFVEPLAVRTMAKAIYTTNNIGHFGLNFSHYAHFTSPIRRYADVLVHRIVEQNLTGAFRHDKRDLEHMCQHISNQERKAQEAERESIRYKQVEFIADHLGEIFEGTISGIGKTGLFVSLNHSRVEGMIGFDKLDGAFQVEESKMKAVGLRSGEVFRIGRPIKVRIINARLEDLEVDMDLIPDPV